MTWCDYPVSCFGFELRRMSFPRTYHEVTDVPKDLNHGQDKLKTKQKEGEGREARMVAAVKLKARAAATQRRVTLANSRCLYRINATHSSHKRLFVTAVGKRGLGCENLGAAWLAPSFTDGHCELGAGQGTTRTEQAYSGCQVHHDDVAEVLGSVRHGGYVVSAGCGKKSGKRHRTDQAVPDVLRIRCQKVRGLDRSPRLEELAAERKSVDRHR